MKPETKSDAFYLLRCKTQVEDKLGWGSSDQWSQADFLDLSEEIAAQTGVNLSVTTLKRLWGKVNYKGAPTGTTLNTLALYLGYENWRGFKLAQNGKDLATPHPAQQEDTATVEKQTLEKKEHIKQESKHKLPVMLLIGAILLFGLVVMLFALNEKGPTAKLPANILFRSKPLAKGIPNTVVFDYDLTDFAFDSAFIQQDWDPRKREHISAENRQHTTVYFFPGHFNAKLVIDDKVVKEHSLLIPTEGWLGIVEREGYPTPHYIPESQLLSDDNMYVSPQVLESGKIDISKDFKVTYANVRDYGVEGDDFMVETAVKNDLSAGGQLCQEVIVFIDGEQGNILVPLSAPGCVGKLHLTISEIFLSGKNQDLSAFGTDLSQWNKLRCEIKDKNVQLILNDVLVHSTSYKDPIGKVKGINFIFHGAGAVDYVLMQNDRGELVYKDEFSYVAP